MAHSIACYFQWVEGGGDSSILLSSILDSSLRSIKLAVTRYKFPAFSIGALHLVPLFWTKNCVDMLYRELWVKRLWQHRFLDTLPNWFLFSKPDTKVYVLLLLTPSLQNKNTLMLASIQAPFSRPFLPPFAEKLHYRQYADRMLSAIQTNEEHENFGSIWPNVWAQ